jgi:predicted NACHT family NTPase
MIERVITEASKIPTEYWVVLIDKTLDFVIGKLPTGKNKLKELIRGHLKNYLNGYSNRYLTTKTLLRRDTPVPFYDVFYPLKLQKKSGSDIIDTSDIANLFINSRYRTIIAGAGSGKSTLTKHLFLDCIQREFGIPVRIELSRLNQDDKPSLEAIITKEVFNNELAQNDSTFKKTLEEGKYVFFLDGFDELSKGNSHKISGELDSFVNRFPKNYFILTSRPYANVEMLPQFSNYELLPLDKEDIEKFIRMLMKDDEEVDEIIDALNEIDDYSYIQSYLTNPLLLTIFIQWFMKNYAAIST